MLMFQSGISVIYYLSAAVKDLPDVVSLADHDSSSLLVHKCLSLTLFQVMQQLLHVQMLASRVKQ